MRNIYRYKEEKSKNVFKENEKYLKENENSHNKIIKKMI